MRFDYEVCGNVTVKPWITRIEVQQRMCIAIRHKEMGISLPPLLRCPHLKSVIIMTSKTSRRIFDKDSKRFVQALTQKIVGRLELRMELRF